MKNIFIIALLLSKTIAYSQNKFFFKGKKQICSVDNAVTKEITLQLIDDTSFVYTVKEFSLRKYKWGIKNDTFTLKGKCIVSRDTIILLVANKNPLLAKCSPSNIIYLRKEHILIGEKNCIERIGDFNSFIDTLTFVKPIKRKRQKKS